MLTTIIRNHAPAKSFACNRVDILDASYEIYIEDRAEREHAHRLLLEYGFSAHVNRPEPKTMIVDDVPEDCWLRFQ